MMRIRQIGFGHSLSLNLAKIKYKWLLRQSIRWSVSMFEHVNFTIHRL
jgi:hypothetical protein